MKSVTTQEAIKPVEKRVWSKYQQAIYDKAIQDTKSNVMINAVAGGAKTTVGLHIFSLLPNDIKRNSIAVAFNKHIQTEFQSRLPEGSKAVTYHSLGFSAVRACVGDVKVDEYKIDNIIKNKVGPYGKFMIGSIKRLIGLCKSGVIDDIYSIDLNALAMDYDIDLFDERDRTARDTIIECVQYAYKKSAEMMNVIDFDDMCFLPVYHNMPLKQYQFIVGDEQQDCSSGQALLLVRSIGDNGRLYALGDKFQSIYRWRGAGENAMSDMKALLHADEMPLSITYRCPKKVVELVNTKFPDIKFEGAEWAKDGKVENIKAEQVEDLAHDGDMILCRVNADLVPTAFSLIRKGIKATVRGRDIGKGLTSLIKKVGGSEIPDMKRNILLWRDDEVKKLYMNDRAHLVSHVQDKVDTILAIADNANSVPDLLAKCNTLFSDDVNGVVLSSIHKAKGLEAERVFILRPDLLPHPAAKNVADKQGEKNLEYVACTRTKDELYWCY